LARFLLSALVFNVLNVKIEVAERFRAVGRLFFAEFYFCLAELAPSKTRRRGTATAPIAPPT